MLEFKMEISAEEHDAFIQTQTLCNLLQSSSWAKVKDNWHHDIVGVYKDGILVASSLVLMKPLPLGYNIMYLSRGPILDYEDEKLVSFFFTEFKRYAKRKKAVYITLDPAILANQYKMEEANDIPDLRMAGIIERLLSMGAQFKGYNKDFDTTNQPRYHAVVELEEDFDQFFSKNAKKSLAIANKKMIDTQAYGEAAVHDFAEVMKCTENRKNIALRGEDYYKKIMQTYGEDAVIYLAKLPIRKLYENSKQRLQKTLDEIKECPENAKKKSFTLEELKASLSREVSELGVELKHGDERVIAGALCVRFGDQAELLYAGMDEHYRRYCAPYTTFTQSMIWSLNQGCKICNMGGIEGTFDGGLAKFKANFNPVVYEFIGEFDIPIRKMMYRVLLRALAYRKRRMHKKRV